MNLAFLLPAAFAALGALLVPLLLHLARRSEQRPTAFAALRWLRARPKPRHRIRFDEWPLLLLRLLLLAALAMLLARPVLHDSASHAPWVAVVPGVDLRDLQDLDVAADARRHWLAPGFPALDEANAAGATASGPLAISSLLRELDAMLPAEVPLTVLVPARLDGVDAQRPRLGRRVDWRVVRGDMPAHGVGPVETAPALSVRYSPDRIDAVRYLRAANAAWTVRGVPQPAPSSPGFNVALAEQPVDSRARFLVWLAPGALPDDVRDWIAGGGVALLDAETSFPGAEARSVWWRDDNGLPLVEGAGFGHGRALRLTRRLSPQAMPQVLEPDFPRHLRALFAAPAAAPTRVLAAAHAPLPGGPVFPQPPRDLQPWLLWAIALLFALERWFASSARRGAAP